MVDTLLISRGQIGPKPGPNQGQHGAILGAKTGADTGAIGPFLGPGPPPPIYIGGGPSAPTPNTILYIKGGLIASNPQLKAAYRLICEGLRGRAGVPYFVKRLDCAVVVNDSTGLKLTEPERLEYIRFTDEVEDTGGFPTSIFANA